jgi:Zn-dependent protease
LLHALQWLYPFIDGLGLGVIAMLLHECGHLLASVLLGVRVKRVGMRWNKGLYTVREHGTPLQNLIIALAGPLVNLLLIATSVWSSTFALANFCYALANVLPIEGSDVYRIAACWQQIRSGHAADRRSDPIR